MLIKYNDNNMFLMKTAILSGQNCVIRCDWQLEHVIILEPKM